MNKPSDFYHKLKLIIFHMINLYIYIFYYNFFCFFFLMKREKKIMKMSRDHTRIYIKIINNNCIIIFIRKLIYTTIICLYKYQYFINSKIKFN